MRNGSHLLMNGNCSQIGVAARTLRLSLACGDDWTERANHFSGIKRRLATLLRQRPGLRGENLTGSPIQTAIGSRYFDRLGQANQCWRDLCLADLTPRVTIKQERGVLGQLEPTQCLQLGRTLIVVVAVSIRC